MVLAAVVLLAASALTTARGQCTTLEYTLTSTTGATLTADANTGGTACSTEGEINFDKDSGSMFVCADTEYKAASSESGAPSFYSSGLEPFAAIATETVGIVIRGWGFQGETVSVDIGGEAATGVSVVSDNAIRATIPASSAAGPKDVTISTSSGKSFILTDGFTHTLSQRDCKAIKANNPAATDGNYMVTIDGLTREVYCDMTTEVDGEVGGWMLMMRDVYSDNGVANGLNAWPAEFSLSGTLDDSTKDYYGPALHTGDYMWRRTDSHAPSTFVSHQRSHPSSTLAVMQAQTLPSEDDPAMRTVPGGAAQRMSNDGELSHLYHATSCGSLLAAGTMTTTNCWQNMFSNNYWDYSFGSGTSPTYTAHHTNHDPGRTVELYVRRRV